MENNREIADVEYRIRKLERGIKVAYSGLLNIKGTSVDYDSMIKQYVEDIKDLRDRLERLTEKKHFSSGQWKILTKGRRQPKIPKWPL
jgi:hypothetical protein